MARIQFADPSVQELEARRIAAELVNRITNPNLTDSEKAEAALNLSNLVELQTPGVEDALKMINRGDAAKEVLFWVPGIGQAIAAGELALNPTWENAGWAALSISPLTRAGGKAAKGAIKGAKKFGDDITWEIKNALETAQDYIRKPAPKTRVGPVAGAKGEQFKEAGKAAAEAAERKAAGIAKGKKTKARNIANKGLRKSAPVTGPVGLGGAAYMTSQLMDGEELQQPREYLGPYSPEYYSDLAETSPELVRTLDYDREEPQPGLQLPMPGQGEEPEGPEDTRTPRQKRKFISAPGRPRGAKRRNPFYVPPPGGEEAETDVAEPEVAEPEVAEPQIDQVMPELANQFAPARRDKTDVVTDQRIGDPSGLDFVRSKPTTPEQRPELPMTGVPGEQPEAIPDMTPTDQDIEGLFDGQGMPERFQDDPSKDAVSAAFLRERAKAFGDARGQIEGAPELYEEPGGVDFIDTPEGQAFLQSDVMPPELVKPDYMSDEEWATLSDAEKRRIMAEGDTSFASTFGANTQ